MDLVTSRREHLCETDELADLIAAGDPKLRIVDMRGYVRTRLLEDGSQRADYLPAHKQYAEGHIPGAIYIDWTRDIVDVTDPIPVQIAPVSQLVDVFQRAGIGDEYNIVAYDDQPVSQFATRLWWVLRTLGFHKVRVLNGGLRKWMYEKRPITAEVPDYPPAHLTAHPRPTLRVTAEEVVSLLGSDGITLLDARGADQYYNEVHRGTRGGHIPGARLLPREWLITETGEFLPSEELLQKVEHAGANAADRCVAYCNGGVAATAVLFALSMLQYPNLSNYDGSWNEWSERLDLPVNDPSIR